MENDKVHERCSCKGIRYCKICENQKQRNIFNNKVIINIDDIIETESYPETKFFVRKDNLIEKLLVLFKNEIVNYSVEKQRLLFDESFKDEKVFDGIFIKPDIFNPQEEELIIKSLFGNKWIESQSGRKKQDYGPKINYKKQKISFENISFPSYKQLIEKKIKEIKCLDNFVIREMGNLLYSPDLGSHIESHIDHTWVWGKRIIGVNLLSDTKMTFSLDLNLFNIQFLLEITIPIRGNSIYVMSDSSRYLWKHGIESENIKSDRVVITLREFNENYYKQNQEKIDKYYQNKD